MFYNNFTTKFQHFITFYNNFHCVLQQFYNNFTTKKRFDQVWSGLIAPLEKKLCQKQDFGSNDICKFLKVWKFAYFIQNLVFNITFFLQKLMPWFWCHSKARLIIFFMTLRSNHMPFWKKSYAWNKVRNPVP